MKAPALPALFLCSIFRFSGEETTSMAGLYIHIPFCIRKCLYCDFYLEPLGTGPIAERLKTHQKLRKTPFLDALATEFRLLPQLKTESESGAEMEDSDHPPVIRTVYIGGGTPTELAPEDFLRLFDELALAFDFDDVVEFTVEANPATLTREKVDLMLERGVTRISLGVQSFDDDVLEMLGRIHNAEEARETVVMLRSAGVDNLNLDLIINLPGSSLAQVDWDLENLIELSPEHCSCYALDWTPGTHLTTLRDQGKMTEIDDELAIAQYQHLRKKLIAAGFHHYELFNFARPGHESQHNIATWRGGDYLGFGPSASSHLGGTRMTNVASLRLYQEHLLAGRSPVVESETLDANRKARELLMTALRQVDGVPRDWFHDRTGFEVEDLVGDVLKDLGAKGWIGQDAERVWITADGIYLSNRIFEAIL